MARAKRPFVFLNLAITADGKIAPARRDFIPFSSRRDRTRMMELRTRADAVMSGARTVNQPGVDLGPGGKRFQQMRLDNGLAEFNLRIVVSGSATLDPAAHIFTRRFSPILLLTTSMAPKDRLKSLAPHLDDIFVSPGKNLDFRKALEWVATKWKVKTLLCEGGGELNAGLFEQNLVDEVCLTICPVIFGGRDAPTLVDGEGISRLKDATRLRLRSVEQQGQELFCVYRVLR